jgi:hypothetical protein
MMISIWKIRQYLGDLALTTTPRGVAILSLMPAAALTAAASGAEENVT